MTFWLAFVVSIILTGVMILVLRRAKVLDVPNARSSHAIPIPRGGGLAVIVAVMVALLFSDGEHVWLVVISALSLGAVGLLDDLRSLPAAVRLIAQASIALAATIALSGSAEVWQPVFLVVGVLGVIAYVNAFNFMDGVNGISAMHATLAGGWFMWVGHEYDARGLIAVGAALAGASLGFLPWNASGRIFLGDVGSYGLGALIAVSTLAFWSEGVPPLLVLAPLVVYLADTGWVLIKRARAGERLTQPHRDHVYQVLVQRGWPHLLAAGWSMLVAATGCLGVALLVDPLPVLALVVLLALTLLYLNSPRLHTGAAKTDGAIP